MQIKTFVAALLVGLLLPFSAQGQQAPQIMIRNVPELRMPGAHEFGTIWGVDGNSPAERDSAGRLILFNSLQYPWRSVGPDIHDMAPSQRVIINSPQPIDGGLWIEAVYRDLSGLMIGWCHNEPIADCPNTLINIARIRQMISTDDGQTWQDLGVILEAPADSYQCETANRYFAGGYGDFTVIFHPGTQYFYFYYSSYRRNHEQQGIAIARMHYTDRLNPAGNVWNWDGAGWRQPGLGGLVATIFIPDIDWHQPNADAYWGPAIHYNTFLKQYVMLLNHAVNSEWWTEGIYISFNPDISNPTGWTFPERLPLEIVSPYQAYPQVIGLEADGTDRTAGQTSRLFLSGQSFWEIVFDPVLVPPRGLFGTADRPGPPVRIQ